jgi:predicted Zn-dependent protease
MTYGMLQQIGLGAAGIALSGKEYADLALSAGAIGSSLLLLKYSRSDELEADRLGLLYMSKLGYNPRNAISAHRNLEKAAEEYMKAAGKDPHEKGFFEDLLSTHPRTSVRIDEIQQMINSAQSSPIAGDGTYRERFRNMTGGLREANGIYLESYDAAARAMQKNSLEEADSLISAGIRRDQRQPAFHALKGFILLRKKDYPAAERNFDLAMKMDSNYEPAYRGMGTLFYLRENYSEGIHYLKKSLSLFPQDLLSHYFLGMSYYRTKQYSSAIPHLNLVAEAQPKHPEIHGTLGICYEQTGDLSSAYNEYVLQVRVASDNEMGRHAASRAGALKPILEKKAR